MPFFSQDFTATALAPKSSTGSTFISPSDIEDGGSIRMAILSESALEGVEVWFTKKEGGMTKRVTPEWPDEELIAQLERQVGGTVTERDGKRAIKHCSAFFVYDYDAEAVKVFSANQKTVLADISRLASDDDYSDLNQWDLKISRSGKGTDTRYTVAMVPTKRSNTKVAQTVIQAWDDACKNGADLEALYDGGYPLGKR